MDSALVKVDSSVQKTHLFPLIDNKFKGSQVLKQEGGGAEDQTLAIVFSVH